MSDCCEEPKMIYWPHVVVNETHEEDIHTFTFIFIILVIINALLKYLTCGVLPLEPYTNRTFQEIMYLYKTFKKRCSLFFL